uniref:Uncharacterized protein n=1 Tax=Arthrobacter sp. Chr15 TaxID=447032 RepID=A6YFU5_9MICC|nr:unknown [Arthrobacter sp. Chr15]
MVENPVGANNHLAIGGDNRLGGHRKLSRPIADDTLEAFPGRENRFEFVDEDNLRARVQPVTWANTGVVLSAYGQERRSFRCSVQDYPTSPCVDFLRLRHASPFVVAG